MVGCWPMRALLLAVTLAAVTFHGVGANSTGPDPCADIRARARPLDSATVAARLARATAATPADFGRADLTGLDLRGLDLRQTVLRGATLACANLTDRKSVV